MTTVSGDPHATEPDPAPVAVDAGVAMIDPNDRLLSGLLKMITGSGSDGFAAAVVRDKKPGVIEGVVPIFFVFVFC